MCSPRDDDLGVANVGPIGARLRRAVVGHLRLRWSRRWIVLAVAGPLALLAFVVRYQSTPTFESRATVRFVADDDRSAARTVFLTSTYVALVETPEVLGEAIGRAGLRISFEDAQRRVATQTLATPGFVRISATGPTATDAQALADATARQLRQLVDTEQTERVDRGGGGGRVEVDVVVAADAPSEPVTPNPLREAAVVFVVAALVASEAPLLARRLRGGLPLLDPAGAVAHLLAVPTLHLAANGTADTRSATATAPPVPPDATGGAAVAAGQLAAFRRGQLGQHSVLTVVERRAGATGGVAALLAAASARAARRTVLLDGDVVAEPPAGAAGHDERAVRMRLTGRTGRGALSETLALGEGPGLVELLCNQTTINAAAVRLSALARVVAVRAGDTVPVGAAAEPVTAALERGTLTTLVAHTRADHVVVSTTSRSPLATTLAVVANCPAAVVVVVDPVRATRAELQTLAAAVVGAGGRIVAAVLVSGDVASRDRAPQTRASGAMRGKRPLGLLEAARRFVASLPAPAAIGGRR